MTRDEQELFEGIIDFTLDGVREYGEGYPVELRHHAGTGRFMLTAWNEGRNNLTRVDLSDVLDWLAAGPADGRVAGGGFVIPRPARK